MPIVSSEIVKNRDRGSGLQRYVREHHTDHNGEVHEHNYYCPVDHDVDQALLEWILVLNENFIEYEKESLQQQIENGVDPVIITLKHLNNNQKAKRIIKALMLGNPDKMLKAAEYVQGFTNAQIENFFTQAQRIRIRARQNYIINNQSVFDDDIREEL